MSIEPPKLDNRRFSDLDSSLKDTAIHYTPEWKGSDEKDPGAALRKIFSRMVETIITRYNRVPEKNFIAFLDMMGIRLLPAAPSRVPVTFLSAKGTVSEILIPAGTQVSGKSDSEELPFETEANLLAIPGKLKRVLSVDPDKDTIFETPPGFLDGTIPAGSKIEYEIVSSPSAGADNFQLDHVRDLKKGDILKIGTASEYVKIDSIAGNIIKTVDAITKSYVSGTQVEKVTAFNLFEGKDLQEHSFYLGHTDLFNVKSAARFVILITHLEGSTSGLGPLKLSWEYWGEDKERKEEGAKWRRFSIGDDRTDGLRRDGKIELIKSTEGEIKEKEINAIKSRWIRCRLEEPLVPSNIGALPVIDTVSFDLGACGDRLYPDQAFLNEIPLDTSKPFMPFGKEPRIFDAFSISSKEAFSKISARIGLDVKLEKRGILGAPCAVSHDMKTKVFVAGTYGRLLEVDIDSHKNSTWIDHGVPAAGKKIAAASRPSALTYGQNISVFVRTEDGSLFERFYNGSQWLWLDHSKEDVNITYDPFSIYGSDTIGLIIMVVITGSNGSIYTFYREEGKLIGNWLQYKQTGDGTAFDSSPHAAKVSEESAEGIKFKIFVKGNNGHLYESDYEARAKTQGDWKDNGFPESGITVDSTPLGFVSDFGSHTRVYVKGSDNNLWEFEVEDAVFLSSISPRWTKKETSGLIVDSDPSGYMLSAGHEEIHVFVRGSDNHLWEFNKTVSGEAWIAHLAPGNSRLVFAPFALLESGSAHVLSTSNRNTIIERMVNSTSIWYEYADPIETGIAPILSWEYWNKNGWVLLKLIKDETQNFIRDGRIEFLLPEDVKETEIAGQKNYWIRARIVNGDYGRETFALLSTSSGTTAMTAIASTESAQKLISSKNSIIPPVIKSITISYGFDKRQNPTYCITYNNLDYIDQSEAREEENKHFSPFVPLPEENLTFYMGFDRGFKNGPVRIFIAAKEIPFSEESKPKLAWSCSARETFEKLSVLDGTEGLVKREILELLLPADFSARTLFGENLHWIRGTLSEGKFEESPVLEGIYPNTVWALQAATLKNEAIGTSDGRANQAFNFRKIPVLEGEDIRVRETLTEEEKQELVEKCGKDALYEKKDDKGHVVETWIRWTAKTDFIDSGDITLLTARSENSGSVTDKRA